MNVDHFVAESIKCCSFESWGFWNLVLLRKWFFFQPFFENQRENWKHLLPSNVNSEDLIIHEMCVYQYHLRTNEFLKQFKINFLLPKNPCHPLTFGMPPPTNPCQLRKLLYDPLENSFRYFITVFLMKRIVADVLTLDSVSHSSNALISNISIWYL